MCGHRAINDTPEINPILAEMEIISILFGFSKIQPR
jgi:hypothetical protein